MPTSDWAEALLAFYSGWGRDNCGRTLTDIWQLELGDLEHSHDYIQWLFPLLEPSKAQPQSPVLTLSAVEVMRRSPNIQASLIKSARVMARFYGFIILEDNGRWKVAPSADLENRRHVWVTRRNHNFLRHTRILKSLTLLGLSPLAAAWLNCLELIYQSHADVIGPETYGYWQAGIV
jgi:hypothetical protein